MLRPAYRGDKRPREEEVKGLHKLRRTGSPTGPMELAAEYTAVEYTTRDGVEIIDVPFASRKNLDAAYLEPQPMFQGIRASPDEVEVTTMNSNYLSWTEDGVHLVQERWEEAPAKDTTVLQVVGPNLLRRAMTSRRRGAPQPTAMELEHRIHVGDFLLEAKGRYYAVKRNAFVDGVLMANTAGGAGGAVDGDLLSQCNARITVQTIQGHLQTIKRLCGLTPDEGTQAEFADATHMLAIVADRRLVRGKEAVAAATSGQAHGFAYFLPAEDNTELKGDSIVHQGITYSKGDFLYVELICGRGHGQRMMEEIERIAASAKRHVLLASLKEPIPTYLRWGFGFAALDFA